jgi:hypothetical protein
MDWNLKMPVSWDLAELEQDAVPAISTATSPVAADASGIAAAAAARGTPTRAECSVDLKLGGLGDFGAADVMKEPKPPAVTVSSAAAAAPAVVSSASPLKRPRTGPGGANGPQCPSCAVDGCKADLSKCRDYHRRHKVCEAHSKTPLVVVAGREMRFCQQCSRYTIYTQIPVDNRSQFSSFFCGKKRFTFQPKLGETGCGEKIVSFLGMDIGSIKEATDWCRVIPFRIFFFLLLIIPFVKS